MPGGGGGRRCACADVHAGGNLVVVQSLGDQAGDGLLGAGQAVPPGDGLSGRPGPRGPGCGGQAPAVRRYRRQGREGEVIT
jgi:hypothetical protein